ncbi:MAG: hypothetical protein IKN55_06835 [Oscillospiraceae bacterium]|nr:hypothetical protein [Oscillospiraceae bacterium]
MYDRMLAGAIRKAVSLAVPLTLLLTGCQYYPPTLRHEERDLELHETLLLKVHLSGDFSDAEPVFRDGTADIPAISGKIGGAVFLDQSAVYKASLTFSYDGKALTLMDIPEEQLMLVYCSRDGKQTYPLKDARLDTRNDTITGEVWELGYYLLVDARAYHYDEITEAQSQ